MPTTALTIPDAELAAIFDGKASLDAVLKRIAEHATNFVFDATQPEDRDAARSLAYKVARSKTTIDNAGKAAVADLKKKAGEIDALRRKARETLDGVKATVLEPVTRWEAEQARIADAIADIIHLREILLDEDTTRIQRRLEALEKLASGDFGPRAREATHEITDTRAAIEKALEARRQREAEQAELARLRALTPPPSPS